jgi:hypothetical protein
MGPGKYNSRGFTLIASLLILVLLSGVAAGLLYLVTDEVRMGGNDLENNLAYYGAESGMEYMTSGLAALYEGTQSPTETQIQGVAGFTSLSSVPGINYFAQITFPKAGSGVAGMPCTTTQPTSTTPPSCPNTVTSGPDTGLYAELTPMQMQVTATRPSGASVTITRIIEVAELPVFQFGVFCGYDCSYFAGPDFAFGGRVHTNMNLFLASQDHLVFDDKVQAYGQIITDRLENGYLTAGTYTGPVYVPNATGGCALSPIPPTGANCIELLQSVPGDASWSGGYPSIAGSANANFPSLSTGTFNGFLANSLTGVSNLQLPFVQNSCVSNPPPCTDPISIVRKPQGESPTSTLGEERMYNKASIRILLADNQSDLHPDWAGTDANDVQFPSTTSSSPAPFVNTSGSAPTLSLTGGTTKNPNGASEALGFATPGTLGWVAPYNDSGAQVGWATWPLEEAYSVGGTVPASPTGAWIRVEYCSTAPCNAHADFVGVTQEWLNLGIGQPFNSVPTTPGSNAVNTNAILILQQLRPGVTLSAANIALTNSWYPINFYDAREGEMRDNTVANTSFTPSKTQTGYPDSYTYSSCSVSGIMNAVELDVGNLAQWLKGSTGLGTGLNVMYSMENGYVLYFSDHRGMRPDLNPSNGGQTPAGVYSGESGLEDVVNSASALTSTTQDGQLEAKTYYSYSPEDVDQNNALDNWGQVDLGYGFGINTKNSATHNAYARIVVTPTTPTASNGEVDCAAYNTTASQAQPWLTGNTDQEGMANTVSGARHVLKLVDGGMSTAGVSPLPVMPAASGCSQSAANPTGCGGITFASENPVYVQGNFNSSPADLFWGTSTAATPSQSNHSAASIIADSVTLLSNQWSDAYSLLSPAPNMSSLLAVPLPGSTSTVTIRQTTQDAYYRVAISGGKNIPFPQPTWNGAGSDFGTDGGMHNFLRYLENWGNTLHFNGSLVNMYYSEYNTGTFKCCQVVYSPPTRDYYFDVLFLTPANLPPATPMFQDVVNLSYHQNFQAGNAGPN